MKFRITILQHLITECKYPSLLLKQTEEALQIINYVMQQTHFKVNFYSESMCLIKQEIPREKGKYHVAN